MRDELKKICGGWSDRIFILVYLAAIAVCLAVSLRSPNTVDDDGVFVHGPAAAKLLRASQSAWEGPLTPEQLQKALAHWKEVYATLPPNATLSVQDRAYAKVRDVQDWTLLLRALFYPHGPYETSVLAKVDARAIGDPYALRQQLVQAATQSLRPEVRAMAADRVAKVKTPFLYRIAIAWRANFHALQMLLIFLTLVIGYKMAIVFAVERRARTSDVYFSTRFGPTRGVARKLQSAILYALGCSILALAVYFSVNFAIYGTSGGDGTFFDIFFHPAALFGYSFRTATCLAALFGIIGMFAIWEFTLCISALSESSTFAVTLPFIIIFGVPLLESIAFLRPILRFSPDKLFDFRTLFSSYDAVVLFGKAIPAMVYLPVLWGAVCIALYPVIRRAYRRRHSA